MSNWPAAFPQAPISRLEIEGPLAPFTTPARQTVANVAATVKDGISLVAFTSLTAARILTGPANPIPGQVIVVKDESGGASGTNTITFTPASGNIDGAANKAVINAAYGAAWLYFNGTDWFTV